ncbi:hypothetical protein CBR59_20535 [Bacillus thuringiensis]|nr:hypothetical protein BAQ53_15485 [Bacillus sp. B25(2016b)]MBR9671620.1 hypothetical protein [Bacillus cereus]PNK30005.1 hypothetical protein CBP87_12150 [Bacillus thuringiensis]QEL69542.1 hypothetical protein DN399_16315 [Bacillus sp. AR4-2]QEL74821.1 hypothetical protein DN405_16315 [Bacillus sp. SH8-8]
MDIFQYLEEMQEDVFSLAVEQIEAKYYDIYRFVLVFTTKIQLCEQAETKNLCLLFISFQK